MEEGKHKESLKVAGRQYRPEDYKNEDFVSSGLAATHEQVNDAYAEGQIEPVIENVDGEDIDIPRKGYE